MVEYSPRAVFFPPLCRGRKWMETAAIAVAPMRGQLEWGQPAGSQPMCSPECGLLEPAWARYHKRAWLAKSAASSSPGWVCRLAIGHPARSELKPTGPRPPWPNIEGRLRPRTKTSLTASYRDRSNHVAAFVLHVLASSISFVEIVMFFSAFFVPPNVFDIVVHPPKELRWEQKIK